ncbi:hypothetical protein L1987_53283 [Smallanthus sonchifolius]|uniref:Uncharacterized protein n=1 Tax=Smallanthus sonchifolius TaxID=185202 RepID=A0ACB9EVV2_9ASTR|nr:hypothetical protein L1987_53283 [Smallanthus sonchifolius]
MESNAELPLLTSKDIAHFTGDVEDIPPITGANDFFVQFGVESKKLWYLAAPAIFTSTCQYSLGAITQTFAGHVGTLDLAAFSIENSFIAAWNGERIGDAMLDMQRSWIILFVTGLIMMFLYIFATPFLLFIGQTEAISHAAGKMALWMIPQLFAYAANFPIAKFLQAQSKIMVMSYISGVALVLHTFFSWLLMLKLGWGLLGGAVVLNLSWWFIVVAQKVYIFSGTCGQAWSGFSWAAFNNLWGFVKLSFASAIMLCLETWYFMALVLFAGYLKNAEIAVDALSICYQEQTIQEPQNSQWCKAVYALTPLLAACLIINNIQPALSGVAIGAGWQATIAYINIACYYIFGVPLGLTLGFALNWGVKGIWIGMLTGTVVQTIILIWICVRTNWDKEASMAEERIRTWSGQKGVEVEQ